MRAHVGVAAVQEDGLGILQCLSTNDANLVVLMSASVLQAAVAGMRAHTGDAPVQEHGLGFLANLRFHSITEVQVSFYSSQGVSF
jgi:hypothetical protein